MATLCLKSGCHWYKVYQRDGDDKEVLWLMEFDSHEAFEKSGGDMEEDFVARSITLTAIGMTPSGNYHCKAAEALQPYTCEKNWG